MRNFLIYTLLAIIGTNAAFADSYTRESDSLELVKLYKATDGPNWAQNEHWLSDKPVGEWHGITTEPKNIGGDQVYVVTKIELGGNGLRGELPALGLPDLRWLILWINRLSGTLPEMELPKLEYFYLSDNHLTGQLPKLNFPELKRITLPYNGFSGQFPEMNMPKLEIFAAMGNEINDTLPNFSECPKLRELALTDNNIYGKVPVLKTPDLRYLNLNNNNLCGRFPDMDLQYLNTIILTGNRFTDLDKLESMTGLDTLDVSYNKLTFEDLEPNMWIDSIKCMNQDTILPLDVTFKLDSSEIESAEVTAAGQHNQYEWLDHISFGPVSAKSADSFFAPDSQGTYICRITNETVPGLRLFSEELKVVFSSIEDGAGNRISVLSYPNPCTDYINIDITDAAAENVEIVIYDASGRLLRQYSEFASAEDYMITVETGNFAPGAYFADIRVGKKTGMMKFVRE